MAANLLTFLPHLPVQMAGNDSPESLQTEKGLREDTSIQKAWNRDPVGERTRIRGNTHFLLHFLGSHTETTLATAATTGRKLLMSISL